MKKLSLFSILVLVPMLVSATSPSIPPPLTAFNRDLYFGFLASNDVVYLQRFLMDQGLYLGPITGNFFSLTRAAVKKFQEREHITPPAGYFGPKTRKRANEILSLPKPISQINPPAKPMPSELPQTQENATSTASSSVPTIPTSPSAPVISNTLVITSTSTQTFPAVEMTYFKIGDITLLNDTPQDILLTSFETILSDEIDSTPNRNQKVSFLWRAGPQVGDALISKTDFTFLQLPPAVGSPNKSVVSFPFPVKVSAGETKAASLWVEQMRYVRSGTLKIQSTNIIATAPVATKGSVNFILTKEPPL